MHQYVSRLHAGQYDKAYEMLTRDTKDRLSLEDWKGAMHTEVLADVQDLSVKELRVLSPGGTCVHTELDFVSRNDQGPYGHYIFYLQKEDGTLRIQDVLTYDRIEGEGFVKVGHFDESREPFVCAGKRS